MLEPKRNHPQDAQIARVAHIGSYFLWSSIALVFVVVHLDGGDDTRYWLWASLALATPHLLHWVSRHSDNAIEIVNRELMVAAFLQGAAVVLLEFRLLPSLAVAAPIVGFVLNGGLPLLLRGLLACGAGIGLTGLTMGFQFTTQTGVVATVFSAILLLVSQLALARTTLKYEQAFRAVGEEHKVGIIRLLNKETAVVEPV